jgi:hypothetical protein
MCTIGQKVDTGGIIGTITQITDEYVAVSGSYNIDDVAYQKWMVRYDRAIFDDLVPDDTGMLNATDEPEYFGS